MANKDYIDPHGYWICPEGGIRRMGDEDGEGQMIVKKTEACSEAEWKRICDAMSSVKPNFTDRALPQFHVERNCVIIS